MFFYENILHAPKATKASKTPRAQKRNQTKAQKHKDTTKQKHKTQISE